MILRILYFGSLAEKLGVAEESVDVAESVATVADLAEFLRGRGDVYGTAFADRGRLRAAVDLVMAQFDTSISHAKEIAFFPPVTGG